MEMLQIPSKCLSLEKDLQANPWNYKLWDNLISEALALPSTDPAYIRKVFDKLLGYFPSFGKYWLQFAEYEYKHQNYTELEEIFEKCLLSTCNCVDLWRLYVKYIRQNNAFVSGEEVQERKNKKNLILKAFEAAVAAVGFSHLSGALWNDYIAFLKEIPADSFYEEQQKMDNLRKLYHRAIVIPNSGLETIWKEYDAFENGLNSLTAKKILGEKSAAYMTARTCFKEMTNILNELKFSLPPVPAAHASSEHKKQLSHWSKLLEWEKSNPLQIEDSTILHSRVIYWYKVAISYLRFHPQIWFSVASYLISVGKPEEAASIFGEATQVLPDSLLIHFSYADFQENNSQFQASKSVYEGLLERIEREIEEFFSQNPSVKKPPYPDLCVTKDQNSTEIAEYEAFELTLSQNPTLKSHCHNLSLVYIHYMRFLRRTEGIKGSRLQFSKARKSPFCLAEIFVAAALLEFHCSKDSGIAVKIFELGVKRFLCNSIFTLEYLKFLITLNDENNTRSLFERVVAAQPKHKAFWELYLDYLYNYGDLVEIQRLEKRFVEIFPESSLKKNVARFSSRYSFLGLSLEVENANEAEKPSTISHSEKPSHHHSEERDKLKRKKNSHADEAAAIYPVKDANVLDKFIQMLPSPSTYNGPLYSVEEIISLITSINLPQIRPKSTTNEESDDENYQSRSRKSKHLHKRS